MKRRKDIITQKRIKEVFNYNPETGILKWRINKGPAKKGVEAGCVCKNNGHQYAGYRCANIDGQRYYTHQIIWIYMKGYLPELTIDHINHNTLDNRWSNLREMSMQCQLRNSSKNKNNTSGVTGVCFHKIANKFMSYIMTNRNNKHLGLFENFEDAVKARHNAELELDWPGCNDSTCAFKYLKEKGLIR